MKKVAVVYWSGTGNTEIMANAVAEGVKANGAEVSLFIASLFNVEMIKEFDAIAFGCPAMGSEELEEDEFKPMFDTCLDKLNGKTIALFGSYGWGDGEWMRDWENVCVSSGVILACDSVICNSSPESDGILACEELGKALV